MNDTRIPVTVLTGFLGSGKTTLLNRILTERHGHRIAVIENEYGEIGIDQALVIDADEEVFEMNNGCICCTVRGDLIRILGNLARRKDRFDHVIVETTGLADPAPVAQTFFVDDEVRAQYRLDGIVTLVDAAHAALHLDDSDECKAQIGFADVLVLNKADLVDAPALDVLERRVRAMNALARVHRAQPFADLPIDAVLRVGGFDLERALAMEPRFLEPEYPFERVEVHPLPEGVHEVAFPPSADPAVTLLLLRGSDVSLLLEEAVRRFGERPVAVAEGAEWPLERPIRLPLDAVSARRVTLRVPRTGDYALFVEHGELPLTCSTQGRRREARETRLFAGSHAHDDTIGSVGIHLEGALDGEKLQTWMSALLREFGAVIFRMKGILHLAGEERRFVFQGVHMLFDGRPDRPWGDEPRANDLVFIGRELDREALTSGLRGCLA